jgi:hypothetical protein
MEALNPAGSKSGTIQAEGNQPLQQHIRTIFALFIIFAIFYAPNLADFLPSIDDELAAFRTNPALWVNKVAGASTFLNAL